MNRLTCSTYFESPFFSYSVYHSEACPESTLFLFQKSQAQWRVVFFISAGITILCSLMYLVAGSGDVQEWAKDDEANESYMIENKQMKQTNGEATANREGNVLLNENV